MSMNRVEIGRYQDPPGFNGWVCTDNWILFESESGAVSVYRRDETGAVTGQPVVLQ